jgi:hypothetical protein
MIVPHAGALHEAKTDRAQYALHGQEPRPDAARRRLHSAVRHMYV